VPVPYLILAALAGAAAAWAWTWRDARRSETPLPRSEWAGNLALGALIGAVVVYAAPFALGAVRSLEWTDEVVAVRTEDELDAFLARAGDEPALVGFFSETCLPCRAMAPYVNDLAAEGRRVATIQMERAPRLAMKYRVQVVPTMLVFRDGELLEAVSGYRSAASLRGILDSHRSAA
jgi:thioredoxin 1